MIALDDRLNAFRPDLADRTLAGVVTAEAFVDGWTAQVRAPWLGVHRKPAPDTMQLTQALMGETLKVFDVRDGWAWAKLDRDGYVGYVSTEGLASDIRPVTHEVSVPSTLIYPKPDLKHQPVVAVPLLSRLSVVGQSGKYLRLASGGFVWADHTRAIGKTDSDFVAVAEKFLHVPYLWGGKTVSGLDCSGLVQIALNAAGIAALRDSDMQEKTLGEALDTADLSRLRRGDLVFWKGHVGIMIDAGNLLHASGHMMMVTIEPLREAVARIIKASGPITSIRRIL